MAAKPRGDWGGGNDRSRELRAIKPPCYAASLYLQRSFDFCFMLNLHGRCLETISFFCIQISSILESQFNINRHFPFSRVDARDSGNNAEI